MVEIYIHGIYNGPLFVAVALGLIKQIYQIRDADFFKIRR